MTADFIGAGWNFPLQVDATNAIALATHARDIEQAIELIIRTAPGERPMRPEFGCRIQDHLFSPTNEATAAAIAQDVRSALELWEPRIDVEDVLVGFDQQRFRDLLHRRPLRIRGDNDERNLVFPFYVIPDEPDAPPAAEQPRIRAERGMMMLPTPNLDDRTFQSLVDDARRLVHRRARTGPSTTSPTLGSR